MQFIYYLALLMALILNFATLSKAAVIQANHARLHKELTYEQCNTTITSLCGNHTLTKRIINPDIVNPDIVNPDIVNPDIINPDITNPDIVSPDTGNSTNATVTNVPVKRIINPDIVNPDIVNPDVDEGSSP